jgi:heat shock protein HtpX
MISALRRLGGLEPGALPQTLQAFGITEGSRFMNLFASHPPIEARIAALESRTPGQG